MLPLYIAVTQFHTRTNMVHIVFTRFKHPNPLKIDGAQYHMQMLGTFQKSEDALAAVQGMDPGSFFIREHSKTSDGLFVPPANRQQTQQWKAWITQIKLESASAKTSPRAAMLMAGI